VNRGMLEHLIRAAADIADDDELIVIGSQAILAQFPDAPAELLISVEADLYPKNHPERWELIDGTIGELSPFHDTFGYYAQGVQEGTAVLPRGWQDRLVPLSTPNTRGATAYCLEIHDLLISKCVASRDKDRRFIRAALKHELASPTILRERLSDTPLAEELRRPLVELLELDVREAERARAGSLPG
jgi:hypothetical protein